MIRVKLELRARQVYDFGKVRFKGKARVMIRVTLELKARQVYD